ncbi:MAG: DUF362 domain-containing protein [Chloroflexi bacterium]|nr:DUF362 domain-containing protein [Chloroflexota bacterium]
MSDSINRREFLKRITSIGLSAAVFSGLSVEELSRFLGISPAFAATSSAVYMAKGGTIEERLKRVLAPLGGISQFVKKGSRVQLKPNAGWARSPEQAATTNPELVYSLTKACYGAKARKVEVYEHPCDNYMFAFKESQVQAAVESAGGRMYPANGRNLYKKIDVPKGVSLKSADVLKPVLDADCFINVPIAKVHAGAKFTFGLKNNMGIILNRGEWHMKNLQQCIADFSSRVRPSLTIIDATRILLTNGPKGPGEVKQLDTLIAGLDPVACDAVVCTLFGASPDDYPCLPMAAKLGVGQYNLNKIRVHNV